MYRVMKKYSTLSNQLKEKLEYAIYSEDLKSTSLTLKHIQHKAYLWTHKEVEYLIVMDLLKTIKAQRYFIPNDLGESNFAEF